MEVNRYAQIFKRYYYGRSGHITKTCWYRGREARYIVNYGTRIRKKSWSKLLKRRGKLVIS